jgi:hypothetical protein
MSTLNLKRAIESEVLSSLDDLLSGKKPIHLVDTGTSVFLNQNRGKSAVPKERSIVSQSPTASILVKKKAFSTFGACNDIRWMDRTEIMLLRATKALFAYKVNQLRAYESLTKLSSFNKVYNEINFTNFIDLLNASKYLDDTSKKKKFELSGIVDLLSSTFKDFHYDALREDVLKIIKRNTFSQQNYLSSWIVDPEDVNDFATGPGTGVIELCNFLNFSSNTVITMGGAGASFTILDPYRILNIIEDDVELAIEEAIRGTIGLLNDLKYGSMTTPPLDTNLIVSSVFEMAGLGGFDPTLNVDYIRDRLRVFYLGKTIINVGDAVHFYIKGNKVLHKGGGLNVDSSYFEIDESILEAEKRLFTNNHIDLKTYKELRLKSESYGMTHVFGGFVKTVNESIQPQSSQISVSCDSNMGWLSWSRFMENPSLANPNGVLEDPLTPYDIKTDATGDILISGAPELLQENKDLLRSGLLSFNSGMLAGTNATESNIYQSQYNSSGSLYGSRVIQHPHGLVYRWKNGVISATADVKTGSDSESLVSKRNLQTIYGMLISDNAVSNLDVANAVSTMVTGQPYNIETFTKLSFEAMNIVKKDNSFNPSDAMSTILNSIRTQNKFYGNFKPFRLITLSQKTINQLTGDHFGLADSKLRINNLRVNKNILKKQILNIKGSSSTDQLSLSKRYLVGTLNAKLEAVNLAIGVELDTATKSTGVDVSQVFNQAYMNDFTLNNIGNDADYDINRALTVVSSQRKFEDVKLNRDQNLLIISDLYDINTEIKLFALNLKRQNFELFKASYIPITDRISSITDQTGFEFFCNTQGHLELRPPLWNKTPLSVLDALNQYEQKTNKKIVPEFLFKLFDTRSSSLKIEISSLNVRIAILALLIGRYPDASLIPIPTINSGFEFNIYGEDSLKFFGIRVVKDGNRESLTITPSGSDDKVVERNNNFSFNLDFDVSSSKKDSWAGNILDPIGDFSSFFLESRPLFNLSGADSVYDLAVEIASTGTNEIGEAPGLSTYSSRAFTPENIDKVRTDFIRNTGIDPMAGFKLANGSSISEQDLIYSKTEDGDHSDEVDRVTRKIDSIFKELERTISSRNSLVVILKSNLKKQEELQEINDRLLSGFSEPTNQEVFDEVFSDIGKELGVKKFADGVVKTRQTLSAITDLLSGEAFKGTLYEHLIDDDSKNILGPGSGRRFIINDEDIKSMNFSENPPSFSRIDVFGQASLIDDVLKSAQGGENLMLWAGATDFDLWRQYGYMQKTVNVPYSNSAEYASKPLALMHLMMQRVKIYSGRADVAGNEYYQPGDTVYIPSKGMLFYVTSVGHTFNFGDSFTTSLTLEYGHPPGIYLPTPLDVIGEQYNKQLLRQGSFINLRTNIGDDNYRVLEPDGSIIFPAITEINKNNIDILLSYKGNQVAFYNMMTDLSTGLLSGDRLLFIRGFLEDNTRSDLINDIKNRIEIVKSLFMNPVMLTQSKPTSLGDDLKDVFKSAFSFNSSEGNSKELMPIVLPNGITVPKIREDQIITQIAYLKRGNDESSTEYQKNIEISCLSNKDLGTYMLGTQSADISKIIELFPKDGPRQSSIFKARSEAENQIGLDVRSMERVIEIGILKLDRFSANLIKKITNNK